MNGFGGWFRQFTAKLSAALRQFMAGRYGTDRLNMVILCAGLAALFGLSKTKVHLIITAACAAIVLAFCWLIKLVLPTAETTMALVRNNIDWIGAKFGADAVAITEQALEYAALSPTLVELVLQLSVALVLPLLCVVLFAVCFFAAWIVLMMLSISTCIRKPIAL